MTNGVILLINPLSRNAPDRGSVPYFFLLVYKCQTMQLNGLWGEYCTVIQWQYTLVDKYQDFVAT
jgi:hypothetical protein